MLRWRPITCSVVTWGPNTPFWWRDFTSTVGFKHSAQRPYRDLALQLHNNNASRVFWILLTFVCRLYNTCHWVSHQLVVHKLQDVVNVSALSLLPIVIYRCCKFCRLSALSLVDLKPQQNLSKLSAETLTFLCTPSHSSQHTASFSVLKKLMLRHKSSWWVSTCSNGFYPGNVDCVEIQGRFELSSSVCTSQDFFSILQVLWQLRCSLTSVRARAFPLLS